MIHVIITFLSSFDMMKGGEIFVPKIPSMKITDVASAIAPNIEQKEVGIRPGEKLHETMITLDDARATYELEDRYVIEPTQLAWWQEGTYKEKGGVKVPDDFCYSSDSNKHWLDRTQLIEMIRQVGIEM